MFPKYLTLVLALGAAVAATPAVAYDPMPDPRLSGDAGADSPRDYGTVRARTGASRRADDAWDSRRAGQPEFGSTASKRKRSAGRPTTD